MKKLLLLLCFALTLGFNLPAQLADGSIAPDFTATDVNGNTYNLYSLLDQGKTVIIDISATWCGPCWFYHNSGALDETWSQFGPNGTNEIMVLWVEGDPTTNAACLSGDETNCTNGTQGNWLAGTEYPVIDDASIADKYEINYFPTIYAICPNRRVVEIGQVGPNIFHNFANNCPVAVGNHNGDVYEMETGLNGDYFCGEGVLRPRAKFQNVGFQSITSATFSLQINGATVQTKEWTGNLPTYDLAQIQFDPYTITVEDITEVAINLDAVNGNTDEDLQDNSQVLVVLPTLNVIDKNRVRLEMRADGKPSEIRWELRGPDGGVLYSGGNPAAQPGAQQPNLTGGYSQQQFIKDTFLLPGPGCYEFYIVDDGGDGLDVSGYYKIEDLDGNTLFESGDYGAEHSDRFKAENIPVASSSPTSEEPIEIFPNPARHTTLVTWNKLRFAPDRVVLSDLFGRQVRSLNFSAVASGSAQVDLAGLTSGHYVLSLESPSGRIVRKVVVGE